MKPSALVGRTAPASYAEFIIDREIAGNACSADYLELSPEGTVANLWGSALPGDTSLALARCPNNHVWGEIAKRPRPADALQRRQAERRAYLKGLPPRIAHGPLMCGTSAMLGRCGAGHYYDLVLRCYAEICPDCGRKDSDAHLRRLARWLPKLRQMRAVRYWVITWPPDMLGELRTRRALAEAGKRAAHAMKRLGYLRGLRRWHFFGETPGWRPHLNVLVDGKYLERPRLEVEKAFLREALGLPANGVIHERYVGANNPRRAVKIVHRGRYIQRATFTDWHRDPEMAVELFGFRNVAWWGKGRWDGPPAWEIPPRYAWLARLAALEDGHCPDCGEPLTWTGPHSLVSLGLSPEAVVQHAERGGIVRLHELERAAAAI